MDLTALHGDIIGIASIGIWAVVALWALVLRLARREETPTFWRAVSVAQVLLVVQLVIGLVLLAMGRRPGGGGAFNVSFHLLYGAGFPLIVLIVGHKWSRDGRYNPHTIFSVVGLVIFALALRGYLVGIHGT